MQRGTLFTAPMDQVCLVKVRDVATGREQGLTAGQNQRIAMSQLVFLPVKLGQRFSTHYKGFMTHLLI